jgi:hypothetical protein
MKIMKYIFLPLIAATLLIFNSCSDDYQLSVDFSVPTELTSPQKVELNVTSSNHIVLSWSGGGATDQSYVIYEVLFDKKDGDFSDPIEKKQSDFGAQPKLTLTHADLNTIARKSGIKPGETGSLSWTVITSKGGDIKATDLKKDIEVTRGDGIDNMPDNLYLYGSATENGGSEGLKFRQASEGVYEIYTTLPQNGKIYFRSSTAADATNYYIDKSDNKLKEYEGDTEVTAFTNPCKITVNFNTLSMSISAPLNDIKVVWIQTWLPVDEVHTNFVYEGKGIFRLSDCTFAIPYRHPGWPEGQYVSDERYYFQVLFGNDWWHWRRMPNISENQPGANEPLSFFEINTTAPWAGDQWTGGWKLRSDLWNKAVDIVIDTNREGMVVHQFEN